MRELRMRRQLGGHGGASATVGGENPDKEAIPPEGVTKRLSIAGAGPELLASADA